MPFPIEPVSPKQTLIGVCLVVSATIRVLEQMGARFSFLGFQPRRIHLGISFATLSEFLMMFRFMWTIAFDAFGTLDSARKGCMFPLPTILALRDTGVHVGSPNGRNVVSNIKTPVD